MLNKTIQQGSYGGMIQQKRTDGRFDVYLMYNMSNPTHQQTSGDVYSRKSYKTLATAERKVEAWIKENA